MTIPRASCLYAKKEHAAGLRVPFVKLTERAAGLIRHANLPNGAGVTVLFDACCLCPTVVQAVRARGGHYIGVGKSNRRFQGGGQSHRLSRYGPNVLRRSGRWMTIPGLRGKRSYRVAERIGHLKKLGEVKVVFSRRRGGRQWIVLVTDDLSRPARGAVADYLRRWSMEMLMKEDLHRTVWRGAVNDVIKVSHERPVLRRLEKLPVAWNRSE